MSTSFLLYEAFERIVRQYFLAKKYIFVDANSKNEPYDFVVRSPEGSLVAVEAKVFRTRLVGRGDVIRAINALERARESIGANEALFFVSSLIAIPIVETGKTQVVDLNGFEKLLADNPQLHSELKALVRELAPAPVSPEDMLAYAIFGDAFSPAQDPTDVQEGKRHLRCY